MAQALSASTQTKTRQSWWRDHWHTVLIIALTLGAAAARLWALDRLPAGIYRDEAYEGLDALRVLDGQLALFFTANNGREPLFVYLLSPLIAVFGRTAFALRLLPALAGVLLIPATYALGRELLGKTPGVVAAALAACSVWTLNLSRLALRATLLPLITALMLTCLARGLRLRRWPLMLCTGLMLALGLYTYLPARFMLIVLALYAIYLLFTQRRTFWWQGWLLLALALGIATAPLAGYFVIHPADFWGRSGQVSVLNPAVNQGDPLGALANSIWRTFLGFFYRGDFIPRHNIPYRPFFEPLLALAFAGGLFALRRYERTRGSALFIGLWIALLCLPTILAEGAPHMLRAVGLLPVLYLPAAVGLTWFSEHLKPQRAAWLGTVLVATALLQNGSGTLTAYRTHLNSEAVYYNYESGATQLALEINSYIGQTKKDGSSRAVLLDKRLWDSWPSLRFLCPAGQYLTVLTDDETLPAGSTVNAKDGMLLVLWPYADNAPALALLPSNQVIEVHEGAYERGDLETEARLLYVAYASSPAIGLEQDESVRWEQGITLIHHNIQVISANKLLVELYWQAQQAPGEAYTVYVHLAREDTPLAQHDGPTAQGYYGTERWRIGDIVVDRHYLSLTQPYDPASSQLVAGIYHWPDMTQLKLQDSAEESLVEYELPARGAQAVP
ncbi:MAG: glycosyltransferase family 39 protein [Chloroflexi bacterium]|nr:glycosyltransferase family 39 protein [Chloroflexota bacterium]